MVVHLGGQQLIYVGVLTVLTWSLFKIRCVKVGMTFDRWCYDNTNVENSLLNGCMKLLFIICINNVIYTVLLNLAYSPVTGLDKFN